MLIIYTLYMWSNEEAPTLLYKGSKVRGDTLDILVCGKFYKFNSDRKGNFQLKKSNNKLPMGRCEV